MKQIKNTKSGIYRVAIILSAVFGLLFFSSRNSRAEIFNCDAYLKNNLSSSTSCDQLIGDAKKKCEIIDGQLKARCDVREIKSKQVNTLARQMLLIDAEQKRNQTDLQKTQAKAVELEQQIVDIGQEINYKENLVKYQQLILSGLMQSYYEYNQEGVLKIVLANQNFSDFFNQSDYTAQSSDRVAETLKTIQEARADLQREYVVVQKKKEESERVKEELKEKNNELQATEIQKQTLLTQTQGEEAKYQQLMARSEQQKLELFNFGSAENLAEINASVSSYPKPKDHLASTSWYFSQRDSRWGSKKIGNSNSTMEDYGCAISSVAMVFKKAGASVDPGMMAKQKIFYYDLIKWPGSWSPGISLVSSINHGNINWKTIDTQIAKGNPVVVYIGKTNGRGGHYVVVHNKDSKDYIVHDPYFGANLYLGTSRSLVGKLGADSGTKMDQMIIYN